MGEQHIDIVVRRVHDHLRDEAGSPGKVFLVDRLWPRGVAKARLRIDGWPKEVAPSGELRKGFGHDPRRWPDFRARYRAELEGAREEVRPLLEAARSGPVTLLYGAKDVEHNNALVLRDYLRDLLSEEKKAGARSDAGRPEHG
ncbi:DUF488 domain-containing protein [Marinactinospora thermotolerans]|uniref:Uncharacterized conserved protein YeaO, DUF488 family n=1 Tax=Marinactinospora thermotolerans DSM 45154 TaxID=1122192 RepID=A0A1T4R158_9ACTN|nr:DUF488 family protein [Marinactinospora thermotolerans]SKA09617.1 Uncharacterized conserved protein YeaO, DUF488 family [Marinactinospora thermotolerans DSM 45154]